MRASQFHLEGPTLSINIIIFAMQRKDQILRPLALDESELFKESLKTSANFNKTTFF